MKDVSHCHHTGDSVKPNTHLCPGSWTGQERSREGRQGAADLQGALAELHQPLDEVVLGFSHELTDPLPGLGQGHAGISQKAQDASKVLPTAVNQDPACSG